MQSLEPDGCIYCDASDVVVVLFIDFSYVAVTPCDVVVAAVVAVIVI